MEHIGNIQSIQSIQSTQSITRGVCRLLMNMGYAVIREFKLISGRRVDIAGLNTAGKFVVVEVKSSPADFRSDGKWQEYLAFCDQYYFAVSSTFPKDILPPDQGLIIADNFNAIIQRPSEMMTMNGQRRRAQTLRFARAAASRLETFIDPK